MKWNSVSTAAKFGRREHLYGRVMGLSALVTIILCWFQLYPFTVISSIVTLYCWAVYLFSHTLEKYFYGKGLRK